MPRASYQRATSITDYYHKSMCNLTSSKTAQQLKTTQLVTDILIGLKSCRTSSV